jgi:hypothetical protein
MARFVQARRARQDRFDRQESRTIFDTRITSGVLFSALVAVDQFSRRQTSTSSTGADDVDARHVNVTAGDGNTHDLLFGWIRRVSKHAAQF